MGVEGIRRNFEEVGGRRRNYSDGSVAQGGTIVTKVFLHLVIRNFVGRYTEIVGGAGAVLESGHPRGTIVPRSTS